MSEFMDFLSTSPHPQTISFSEFRDFLILMPRKASTIEIYRYYQFRKNLGDDGHGSARVSMDGEQYPTLSFSAETFCGIGDVSLSAEDRPGMNPKPKTLPNDPPSKLLPPKKETEEGEHHHSSNDVDTNTAFKFLLAGGIAGAGASYTDTETVPYQTISLKNGHCSI